ncbi:helix-turn-helix domain-containing protein [Spirosoma foliorum]|uniref:Helix-turn-helix domain-containing protein n=1 Tax=Spirosoma foliorum TaxID=2710596 RepID=A0A7G5H2F2_9BACT|nr:helix-turn-helix domain-containing protein [Spirosoma foliorum]QMW05294.1 helix-turn-helix domain-containing protein [Spirosoma foliorum]
MAYSSRVYMQHHGQTFLVEIEGDSLYLVVQNEDSSFKRLGPSAQITSAPMLDPVVFPTQPHYEGVLNTGHRYSVWENGGAAYKDARKEREALVKYLIDKLLDKVIDLFPGNKKVQYTDPVQQEVDSERLKSIRSNLGLTQEQFGEFLGNSAKRTVQDWESGVRKIPSTVVEILRLKGQL